MKKMDEKIVDIELKNLIREEQEKIIDKAIVIIVVGIGLIFLSLTRK